MKPTKVRIQLLVIVLGVLALVTGRWDMARAEFDTACHAACCCDYFVVVV